MTFTDYCEKNNIHLNKKDIKWMLFTLQEAPKHRRNGIMKGYAEVWMDVLMHCGQQENRQEMARLAANALLRVSC